MNTFVNKFTNLFYFQFFLILYSQGLLDMEKLETLSKQIELDRIAEEFKKLHSERQQLVTRWQVKIVKINVSLTFLSIF